MAPSAPTLLPSLLFLLLPRAQSAFVLHPPLPAARTRARAVSASMALEAAPFVALADAVQDVAADPSWFDSCALACPAARAAREIPALPGAGPRGETLEPREPGNRARSTRSHLAEEGRGDCEGGGYRVQRCGARGCGTNLGIEADGA